MILLRTIPHVWRSLVRRPARTLLTVMGIAVATFLFCFVETMRDGVNQATQAGASETRLVVYRENRFCPFTSQIPQSYERAIRDIPGVRSVVPMKIIVSNCRASLDIVTFRGVPAEALEESVLKEGRMTDGSAAEWARRTDSGLVGAGLAERRGIKVGDAFTAAGISVQVAGIVDTDNAQDRNAVFVHLPFLQETAGRGGTGGIITQFNVTVDDPSQLVSVAKAIDDRFEHDQFPTATRPESAFVARAAHDVLALVGFASLVGWSALAAVFALVANAIILSVRDRVKEHAILQTLGFPGWSVGWMVLLEASALGMVGGAMGAGGAWLAVRAAHLNFTMEGVSIEVQPHLWLALLGLALASALGLVAGVYPAIDAARRDIVSGLRTA